MEKKIDEILQLESTIPLSDNKKIPIPVGIISILSLLYYAYSIRETAIILQISGIDLLFLVALIISIAGFCFAIGILFLKMVAIYGYTLVWVLNFGILIKIGYFNLWFFIAYIISLIVVWNYKNYFMNGKIPTLENSQIIEIEDYTKKSIINFENKHYSKDQLTDAFSKVEVVINKIRSIKINEKYIVVILSIWSFTHTYLLLISFQFSNQKSFRFKHFEDLTKFDLFYPFTSLYHFEYNFISFDNKFFDIRFYDYTEYFIYVLGTWLIFILYKYLKK